MMRDCVSKQKKCQHSRAQFPAEKGDEGSQHLSIGIFANLQKMEMTNE